MNKIFFILIILVIVNLNGFGKDIVVNPGASIKSAVENSADGDRIIVKEGHYKESEILIDKRIELIGEGYPAIDGFSKGEIIIIRHDSVTVKGFYVNNSGFSGMKDYAAIRVENSKHCNIISNKLINNYFGIYLAGSDSCNVMYNEATSNAVSESSSGNGIHLWKCSYILVKNNTITGHRDGIYFEFATHSRAEKISANRLTRFSV